MAKKKENEGLLNAVKFCVYPCDIEGKYISIPHNEIEEGSQDLSVRFLTSNYGFKIQSSIEGVAKKEHFDPKTSERKEVIRKGLIFKSIKTKARYEITSDEDERGFFVVSDIDSNSKGKLTSKVDILNKIKSKGYIITQYVK